MTSERYNTCCSETAKSVISARRMRFSALLVRFSVLNVVFRAVSVVSVL